MVGRVSWKGQPYNVSCVHLASKLPLTLDQKMPSAYSRQERNKPLYLWFPKYQWHQIGVGGVREDGSCYSMPRVSYARTRPLWRASITELAKVLLNPDIRG